VRLFDRFAMFAVMATLVWAAPLRTCAAAESQSPPAETEQQRDMRLKWWREARFGMFIHWGLYSVPAGEWQGGTRYGEWIMQQAKMPATKYAQFAAQFNPIRFDAAQWVRIAKDAGMKYVVVTAKHHDGFCMFDTALTDFNIVKATPFRRDPLKDLAAACHEAGLTFCVYYSVPDWHHPEFPARYSQKGFHGNPKSDADLEKYVAFMKGQLRELLSNYGPIGIVWFDGGGSFRPDESRLPSLIHAQEIIDMIHQAQPACLVNDRLGLPADFGTPESHIPGERPKTTFEVCMSLNKHWGYNKFDHNWKEPPQTIRNLVDVASKGGNYLLNVGPTAEGVIPPDAVRILGDVGRWMKVNGQSIYGTNASPLRAAPPWGRVTAGAGKLYLHVFDWPKDGKLLVPGLTGKVANAYLLADPKTTRLAVAADPAGVVITVGATAPDPIVSVVVLEK